MSYKAIEIEFPDDKSANWDKNLIIIKPYASHDFGSSKSKVYEAAIGGLLVLCKISFSSETDISGWSNKPK